MSAYSPLWAPYNMHGFVHNFRSDSEAYINVAILVASLQISILNPHTINDVFQTSPKDFPYQAGLEQISLPPSHSFYFPYSVF